MIDKNFNWKEFQKNKITVNGRWLTDINSKEEIFGTFYIPHRNTLPQPDKSFHGIWIAEIPYQMLKRFTKENDTIWSQFGGSGVDYEVCKLLNRKCIINDINPVKDYIIQADSSTFNCGKKIDLILSHPPYYNIIKYSDNINDGSTKPTLMEFINWYNNILNNSLPQLKENGYFILCCGNIYINSEEIELGNLLSQLCIQNGLVLKQHIIKDYGETKSNQRKNYNLNYYRMLKGGYGNFYGDNIYIFKNTKSKNKTAEILSYINKKI